MVRISRHPPLFRCSVLLPWFFLLLPSSFTASSVLSRVWSSYNWRKSPYYDARCPDFQVWHSRWQSCETLYATGGVCERDEWLTRHASSALVCSFRLCPRDTEIFVGGQCVSPRAPEAGGACPAYMEARAIGRGDWDCDCVKGSLFWPRPLSNQYGGECRPAYHRGPCAIRHLFVPADTQTNLGHCVLSPCPDGEVYVKALTPDQIVLVVPDRTRNGSTNARMRDDFRNRLRLAGSNAGVERDPDVIVFVDETAQSDNNITDEQGSCEPLGSRFTATGVCAYRFGVVIDTSGLGLACGLTPRNLISMPSRNKCPRGKRLDQAGNCRRTW